MKKRVFSAVLVLVMVLALLPVTAFAAPLTYGKAAIYSGDVYADYMASEILKKIDLAGKNDIGRIRAVYDWIILNCERESSTVSLHFDPKVVLEQGDGAYLNRWSRAILRGEAAFRIDLGAKQSVFDPEMGMYYVSSDANEYVVWAGTEMMMYRVGQCHNFSALLTILLGHLGYDCRLIEGNFINNNGSKVMHKWNMVLLNGKYYWLDVRMDHQQYQNTKKLSYTYFMIDDQAKWEKKHEWDHSYSDSLMAMAGDITAAYNEMLKEQAEVGDEMMPWGSCSAWAEPYLLQSVERKLFPDLLAGQNMARPITRREFACVAVQFYEALSGKTAPLVNTYKPGPFTDITTADVRILQAYELGIVNGMGDGTYKPNDPLSRAQAVTMLGRVCELVETGKISMGETLKQGSTVIPAFTDGGAIANWAVNYINYFVSHGVVNGVSTDPTKPVFDPNGQMTCEAALKVAVTAME